MAFLGFPAGGDAAERVGYSPAAKMKRKDPEEVYDDFFEFSLSSPARKIRRLDAELPPIVLEEEKPTVLPRVLGQPVLGEQQRRQQPAPGLAEVGSSVACNEERAIVLYKPVAVHPPLLDSPLSSSVSLRVDRDVIAGFKNDLFVSDEGKLVRAMEERAGAEPDDDRDAAAGGCLAVVPWVPSQMPVNMNLMREPAAAVGLEEVGMESEDVEGMKMDLEEEVGIANAASAAMAPAMSSGGLGHWHWQQHCSAGPEMIRPSTPSPIMWYWG